MKWGSRKGSSSSSSHTPPTPSADHMTVQAYKARVKAGGVKTLSNNELQALVTRSNLEQQHRDLMSKEPTTFEKGHKHIKKILAVGKTLNDIHNTANGPVGKAVRKAVTKK